MDTRELIQVVIDYVDDNLDAGNLSILVDR